MSLPAEFSASAPEIDRVPTTDYISLLKLSYRSSVHYYDRFRRNYPDWRFPASFVDDIRQFVRISAFDVSLVLVLAVFWTILRHNLCQKVFEHYARQLKISPINLCKFHESTWRLIFYSSTWSWSFYTMILSGKYPTFWDPLSLWDEWRIDMTVPWDIYVMYVVQSSFYVHSIYATIYMDIWRKDSALMIVHHFLTIALIAFSYGTRHHMEGALVLLLHDNTDMVLEFTKICVYLSKRDGRVFAFFKVLGDIFFVIFTIMWFVFRLYWYPLKLLYTVMYAPYLAPIDVPFFPLFAGMLIVLLGMNLYWFHFIVAMIVRVLKGKNVEDNREYDSETVGGVPCEELSKQLKKLNDSSDIDSLNNNTRSADTVSASCNGISNAHIANHFARQRLNKTTK